MRKKGCIFINPISIINLIVNTDMDIFASHKTSVSEKKIFFQIFDKILRQNKSNKLIFNSKGYCHFGIHDIISLYSDTLFLYSDKLNT